MAPCLRSRPLTPQCEEGEGVKARVKEGGRRRMRREMRSTIKGKRKCESQSESKSKSEREDKISGE